MLLAHSNASTLDPTMPTSRWPVCVWDEPLMRKMSVICAIACLLSDQILKPLLCIFFYVLLYRPEDALTRAPRILLLIY